MQPDFPARTIDILAKRAALRCSNPDCDKLTAGPNSSEHKATNIGQAAHICSARPGGARYRPEMSDEERSATTNGIWLCSDCHSLIDKDPLRFPVELLFLWKEAHERKLVEQIGKPGDALRRLAADREVRSVGDLPLYAEQLIREKPDHWEYMLTAELLDFYLAPVMRAAGDLERGLILKRSARLPREEVYPWLSHKIAGLSRAPDVLLALIREIQASWGAPGTPGDPVSINHACKLFAKAAEYFVMVADEIQFTHLPDGFQGLVRVLMEGALYPLKRIPELAAFIRSIFNQDNPSGKHHFELVLELPDGWDERIAKEMKVAETAFLSGL
ncbi:hypothetical protein F3X89_17430 [Rhizobium rhizogenes]|uniref:HNH endonuclease n=1 Tax=Rhizobium rhizogenes TaxID=359 RepID=UPI00193D59E3|nr:HNH endonuclease [Rhizobium rhizogenes]QRM39476.1 hypothetical protein F3X89_17430 [Rhizobium rhizogenes]